MRQPVLLALIAVGVWVSLFGCRPAPPLITATPTPPSQEQATPVEIVSGPTLTPPATSSPALSVTRTSTWTATPTWTASPTQSATPTLSPSPTVASSRTPTRTRTLTPTPPPTPTAYPIPTGNITRLDNTFKSAALQMDREVIVYLPPGYSTQTLRRYPVVYLLHGYGGFNLVHTTEWEQVGLENIVQGLITSGKIQPMIIVQPLAFMPDGECSLFFNHGPGTDGKPWGDYIWRDVVGYVDSNYRTIPNRDNRAIGGFSFGGQGALSLALLHPDVFKAVGGHSPSFRGADGSIGFMNDWNYFNQFDPIWLVQNKTTSKQLSIWLDVAAGDDKVRSCGDDSDRCVEAFHSLLVSRGIPHEWHDTWPGPHELSYWIEHTPDYLAWYSSQLSGK